MTLAAIGSAGPRGEMGEDLGAALAARRDDGGVRPGRRDGGEAAAQAAGA